MTENQMNRQTALVLGVTGGIGGAAAAKLIERGWHVRALHRNPGAQAASDTRIEWTQGDCMRAGDVLAAARGVSLIVHAVNPPGYRDWEKLVLPMLDNSIEAARSVGARILLPGTVYNFGPETFPVLREDDPQHPQTRKGRIRAEMERRLKQAAEAGVPVLIVRAGDFFGPGAGNSWFTQGMISSGRPVRSVSLPGAKGVGHTWAYLPDVAETMLRLVEQADRLPTFSSFNMRGVWDADGLGLVQAIRRVTGREIKTSRMPWWAVRLIAPFHRLSCELSEMRYLWQQPLRLDNSRLVSFLGAEPNTPLDEAMRATLADAGAL